MLQCQLSHSEMSGLEMSFKITRGLCIAYVCRAALNVNHGQQKLAIFESRSHCRSYGLINIHDQYSFINGMSERRPWTII